jgi:hypothetical protein
MFQIELRHESHCILPGRAISFGMPLHATILLIRARIVDFMGDAV